MSGCLYQAGAHDATAQMVLPGGWMRWRATAVKKTMMKRRKKKESRTGDLRGGREGWDGED